MIKRLKSILSKALGMSLRLLDTVATVCILTVLFLAIWLCTLVSVPLTLRLFGWLSGAILPVVAPRRKRIIDKNLTIYLKDATQEERGRIAIQNTQEIGKTFVFIVLALTRPKDYLKPFVDFGQDMQKLRDAMKEGSVMLFVHHWLYIDLMTAIFYQEAPDIAVKGETLGRAPTFRHPEYRLLFWVRNRFIRKTHYNPVDFIQSVRKERFESRVLTVVADHAPYSHNAELVPFFGIPTPTLNTVPKLGKIMKARVFFYTAHFESTYPIKIKASFTELKDFAGKDLVTNLLTMNHLIEEEIKKYPQQYLLAHRRFKRSPEYENFYKQ